MTFRDIINPVIIEEVKPIQLRITIQPGDTAVFKYDQMAMLILIILILMMVMAMLILILILMMVIPRPNYTAGFKYDEESRCQS